MKICTPYTYRLTFKPTGQSYYGVRWRRGCSPEDLFKSYFSSSKEVKRLIHLYGVTSFEAEVRRVFESKQAACNWEHRVLKRLRVASNSNWINRKNNAARELRERDETSWIHDPYSMKETYVNLSEVNKMLKLGYVLGRSPTMKAKLSTSKKGLQSGKNNPMYGKKRADLSARNSQPKKWITNGTESYQILRDDLIPDGWTPGRNLSHTKKPKITCECKGCGVVFYPSRNKPAKYHSSACANKHTASLR